MYSDSVSQQSGFGTYVSNFGASSGVYEKQLTNVLNFGTPAASPDTYNTILGLDVSGTKPARLLRRVEFYLKVALTKKSTPTSIENLIKSKI